ncbi:MAG: DUF2608 domain-containing protein [Enterobacterales bacterium]|nr:DUF2608 domain-containing protein [Enterobacterales bacterium]
MKILIKLAFINLLLACSFFNFELNAKTQVFQKVNDLNQVVQQIAKEEIPPNKILVIFDIDDTLLDSQNFVGSGKWYNWQRGRSVFSPEAEPIKIHDSQKYTCIFNILGTLF